MNNRHLFVIAVAALAFFSHSCKNIKSPSSPAPATATQVVILAPSNTPSQSATVPPVFTATATRTRTNTPTLVPTTTNTAVFTGTFTYTSTSTASRTFTPTLTSTNTVPPGSTATDTFTVTNTPTSTATGTDTGTSTNTGTPTNTGTVTNTFTVTRTFTATGTATNTVASTNTPTPTSTLTPCPPGAWSADQVTSAGTFKYRLVNCDAAIEFQLDANTVGWIALGWISNASTPQHASGANIVMTYYATTSTAMAFGIDQYMVPGGGRAHTNDITGCSGTGQNNILSITGSETASPAHTTINFVYPVGTTGDTTCDKTLTRGSSYNFVIAFRADDNIGSAHGNGVHAYVNNITIP